MALLFFSYAVAMRAKVVSEKDEGDGLTGRRFRAPGRQDLQGFVVQPRKREIKKKRYVWEFDGG
jgi:hypothetical protein